MLLQPSRVEERNHQSMLVTSEPFPIVSGYTVATSVNGMNTQFFNWSVTLNNSAVVRIVDL